eukprot:1161548-Pelagomonas_calceolata.AAC.9
MTQQTPAHQNAVSQKPRAESAASRFWHCYPLLCNQHTHDVSKTGSGMSSGKRRSLASINQKGMHRAMAQCVLASRMGMQNCQGNAYAFKFTFHCREDLDTGLLPQWRVARPPAGHSQC